MTDHDSQNVTSLDLTGLKCPLPVLKARRAIKDLKLGDRLEVIASDPAAQLDFPHFCETSGHELMSMTPQGEGDDFIITIVLKVGALKLGESP